MDDFDDLVSDFDDADLEEWATRGWTHRMEMPTFGFADLRFLRAGDREVHKEMNAAWEEARARRAQRGADRACKAAKEKGKETARAMIPLETVVPEEISLAQSARGWVEVFFNVDSGASETVAGKDFLPHEALEPS